MKRQEVTREENNPDEGEPLSRGQLLDALDALAAAASEAGAREMSVLLYGALVICCMSREMEADQLLQTLVEECGRDAAMGVLAGPGSAYKQ